MRTVETERNALKQDIRQSNFFNVPEFSVEMRRVLKMPEVSKEAFKIMTVMTMRI